MSTALNQAPDLVGAGTHLVELADALRRGPDVRPTTTRPTGPGAVFLGSGDSLSSALLAEQVGARARSAGDLAWTGRLPAACDEVVGISHSGSSAATVQALQVARAAGARTIAVTTDPGSPLAAAADEVQVVPPLDVSEDVPVAGHLMLGLGVAAVCGLSVEGARRDLADALVPVAAGVADQVASLPATAPAGVSVLTLPDLRGAGDFWMLKLIEATGLPVRAVPLEESGHVDYFLGPQPNLVVALVGTTGVERFEGLARALESTGQVALRIDVPEVRSTGASAEVLRELLGAALGAAVSEQAAVRWARPLFRGGAVNMDASHIKVTPG